MQLDAENTNKLAAILGAYPRAESSLIMVLQDVHREWSYLPCEVLTHVAGELRVPLAKVYSVATFYRAFSLKPRGKVLIRVCMGTACHIRGAPLLVDEVGRRLGIGAGETTADLGFTLETVNCVGTCAMAPVMIVGERYHGEVKPVRVGRLLGGAAAATAGTAGGAADEDMDEATPEDTGHGQD
jgi:NADH-quinone oxidoreductase subunit E